MGVPYTSPFGVRMAPSPFEVDTRHPGITAAFGTAHPRWALWPLKDGTLDVETKDRAQRTPKVIDPETRSTLRLVQCPPRVPQIRRSGGFGAWTTVRAWSQEPPTRGRNRMVGTVGTVGYMSAAYLYPPNFGETAEVGPVSLEQDAFLDGHSRYPTIC